MPGLGQVFAIAAELMKLVNLIFAHKNDPAAVQAKLSQLHEDFQGQVRGYEAALQDPNASDADKQKALDAIRMADS